MPGGDDDESGEAASSSGPAERLPCMVTEVVSGQEFFLQVRASSWRVETGFVTLTSTHVCVRGGGLWELSSTFGVVKR